ncbi:MAG: 3-phosphoshikimate 1-carboxyvinyltransferase, partial [Coriobacteriales bacterium]
MREPEGNRKVAPFVGSIEVPPDKSISHRALMLASMAEGTSHLTNLLNSQDVRSTASCMSALGAKVDVGVSGKKFFDADVTGWGGRSPKSPEEPLDCGNSGTTTRLLLGMLSGYDVTATLVGDESLSKRPMQRVVKPLSMMGARFSKPGGEVWTEGEIVLPIQVEGTSGLKGIDYSSPKASAQVKTSILLAAIHCDGSADLAEPYQSRNHTELMFPAFGLQLEAGNCKVHMDGGQKVTPCDVHVPGDVSSAMFPIVAASLVPGSHIKILNLGLNPTRTAAIEVARRMGC